jgi:hypothetical protein
VLDPIGIIGHNTLVPVSFSSGLRSSCGAIFTGFDTRFLPRGGRAIRVAAGPSGEGFCRPRRRRRVIPSTSCRTRIAASLLYAELRIDGGLDVSGPNGVRVAACADRSWEERWVSNGAQEEPIGYWVNLVAIVVDESASPEELAHCPSSRRRHDGRS